MATPVLDGVSTFLAASHGMLIAGRAGGEKRRALRGPRPRHRRGRRVGAVGRDAADVDDAVPAAREAFPVVARPCLRPGARSSSGTSATRIAELCRRARADRDARQRQAGVRGARGRHSALRRALPLLRRLGDEDRRAVGIPLSVGALPRLHAPRAGRRRRRDHPLELPAADVRLQARPLARGRQHRRAQAGRADAAVGACAWPSWSTEVGFPPGVVNVVTGFGETAGAPLAAHPDVDKITFTGEHATGQKIARGVEAAT